MPPDPGSPSLSLSYRQGVIVAWNPATAENQVQVGGPGGPIFENLPVLNTSEALLLTPGAKVGLILIGGAMMAVLGRLAIPGTADAASALLALQTFRAFDTDNGSTASNNVYVDLDSPAEVGPLVVANVGPSGRARVTISSQMQSTPAGGPGAKMAMSFAVTGATNRAASDETALVFFMSITNSSDPIDSSNQIIKASYTHLLEGLNPGEHTFTCKYSGNGSTANFTDREIIVEPL
jgi:hypothetical protein